MRKKTNSFIHSKKSQISLFSSETMDAHPNAFTLDCPLSIWYCVYLVFSLRFFCVCSNKHFNTKTSCSAYIAIRQLPVCKIVCFGWLVSVYRLNLIYSHTALRFHSLVNFGINRWNIIVIIISSCYRTRNTSVYVVCEHHICI